jgi:hypothetical protein
MAGLEPILHSFPNPLSQGDHLIRVLIRNSSSSFISANVSSLSKEIELSHQGGIRPYGQTKALNEPVMMSFPGGPVSTGCQRRG